jgi:hypothetical protein
VCGCFVRERGRKEAGVGGGIIPPQLGLSITEVRNYIFLGHKGQNIIRNRTRC